MKINLKNKLSQIVKKIKSSIPEKNITLYLSPIVGLCGGLAAISLKLLIHQAIIIITGNIDENSVSLQYLIFPTVGILLTVLLIKFVIKENIGHGVSKILYAFSKNNSKIKKHNIYSSMVTSTVTIGFGGSVGAEAPVVLTGAAIGSNIGQFLKLNYKSITLLAGCGAAAAIGGIFNAPLAGLLFTIEVLMLDLTTASLLPLLISAITATTVSYFFLGDSYHFTFSVIDKFAVGDTLWIVALGVMCGFTALYFTNVVKFVEGKLEAIDNQYKRLLIGGVILGVIIFIFPPLWGEGYIAIGDILRGDGDKILNSSYFVAFKDSPLIMMLVLVAVLAFKAVATAVTTGAGGIGGVFAPSLFMGCLAGYIFAVAGNYLGLEISPMNFALYGMAGVMAGVMHAPLTALFLIAEITGGYALFIPLMMVSATASVTARVFQKYSIYHYRLAKRGELLTHDKDKTVLTLLKLKNVIETDLIKVSEDSMLRDLVSAISKSKRNIFPVVNGENMLVGIVLLEDVRTIMFENKEYDTISIKELMSDPPAVVGADENMEVVMDKFSATGAWNLPVVENSGKYVGFISKSTIFNAYRSVLAHYSED